MKLLAYILSLFSVWLLSGCASGQRSMITPPDLGVISHSVAMASTSVSDSLASAISIEKTGASAHDPRIKQMVIDLRLAKDQLDQTKIVVTTKQSEINGLASSANKLTDRLNYLEPKYSKAVGVLWKWRIIAIGSWLLITCYFVFRGWLKANFPLIGGFL